MGAYYVLVDEDGSVQGRFNLVVVRDGVAELGYRVAQHVTGRGVAIARVRGLCLLAASRNGLRTPCAATSPRQCGVAAVLRNAGFTEVGPADPSDIGGKQDSGYQRDIVHVSPCDAETSD